MAKSREEPDPLSCSICLDILTNPVALQCGHSYCMDCVNSYWDQGDQSGIWSCPQCRQIFNPRPVLKKNTVLAELTGKMSRESQTTSTEKAQDSPENVECDFCTVQKLKAVKSCLVCLASYCATHLQPHYESAAFKRHQLVDVSDFMQEKICPKHDKLVEVYCRTDGQCICLLCVMDEHKGHDTVSAAAERKDRQKQFGKTKQKYQQRIQQKEKQLRELQQKSKRFQCSVDEAVERNEKGYTAVVLMAEKRRCAVRELITVQNKAVMSRVMALRERLVKEISGLRKREDELKRLSLTEDHIYFLQNIQSIFDCPEPDASCDFNIHASFDFVTKFFSDLRDKMEETTAELCKEFQADPDPKTRQEFLLYSYPLILDPNTASVNLLLSKEKSKVSWIRNAQEYPHHPERFTSYDQVLCTEGLLGVCYWEVEWQGPRVEVAVCYKGADLEESGFGDTDHSWCISLSNSGCSFWHDQNKTKILKPCSSTVAVYLNYKAGSLSFYSVSGSGLMTLLQRVQTTFSQPLYPGFMVSRGSSVRIVSPK